MISYYHELMLILRELKLPSSHSILIISRPYDALQEE